MQQFTSDERGIIRWALMHDGPEAETGDLDRRVKDHIGREAFHVIEGRLCPWYTEWETSIHPAERIIVKIADYIEAHLFILEWGTAASQAQFLPISKNLIDGYTDEARSRFGWSDLPAIVESILTKSGS